VTAISPQRSVAKEWSLYTALALSVAVVIALLWALGPGPAHAADPAALDPGFFSLKHRMPRALGFPTTGAGADMPADARAAWWAAAQEQVLRGALSGPWTRTGAHDGDRFGWSVGSAGDVNGDGYADIVVGAYEYDGGHGAVYVFHGSASGPSATESFSVTGEYANDRYGRSVAAAGDVNGDGYADLIVGAPYFDTAGSNDRGKVYVYHGSSGGLNSTPAFNITGENDGDWLGYSVASAGDVNGDGYSDVIVGARNYGSADDDGAVYVYYGGSGGLSLAGVFSATGSNEYLGAAVAPAGDVNGDGYADVVVGGYGYSSGRGRVYVAYGSSSGLSGTGVFSVTGENSGDRFGWSVATAGDVNGDGCADVIVGAKYYGSGNDGAAYIYYGSSSGLHATDVLSFTGQNGGDWFGQSVATAGDVNGDGYADVVVGAHGYDGGLTSAGSAYVYHGGGGGLNAATPAFTITGENSYDYLGVFAASAGDVNEDGYSDVIVGAYGYPGGLFRGKAYVYYGAGDSLSFTPAFTATGEIAHEEFGDYVATAGDVNGDGYTDIVVGARNYSASSTLTDTGRVYLYQGSADGLSVTPVFTATGESAYAEFGVSACGGDVNGDGYDDLIVGADHQYGSGAVYVYHGSSAGLNTTPTLTITNGDAGSRFGASVASNDVNGDGYADLIVGAYYGGVNLAGMIYVYYGSSSGLTATGFYSDTGVEMCDYLGTAVASAGDVNGDGYGDVVVCADRYNKPGRVYVYHGGSDGLSETYAVSVTGESSDDLFGGSLATAGDVNGDGFADVVIGAEGRITQTGQAYVFYGSSSGLDTSSPFTLTGEDVHDRFGRSVASAGDVNGDGFADLAIGAYGYGSTQGRVYIYHGGPGGLSAADLLSVTGRSGDYLGEAVATAGDVNGDGFADVAVGSPYGGSSEEGVVQVYHGGGGGGRTVRLRQTRGSASSALVQPWGMATGLYVRLNGTDPMGRGRVKLQVEACPPGAPFGDASCVLQTSLGWEDTTSDAHGVPLEETVSGLFPETLYRWRARLLYAPYSVTEPGITPPPNPAHGPWRRLYGQGLEADLRTGFGVYLPLVLCNFP